jgi:hypothetical protein
MPTARSTVTTAAWSTPCSPARVRAALLELTSGPLDDWQRLVVLLSLLTLVLGGWRLYGYLKLHGIGLLSSSWIPSGAPHG